MSPFKTLFLSTIIASGLAASGAASATVLYQNLPDLTDNPGNCRYNTLCGPGYAGSTYYGAQKFTLTQAATATSAGFNSIVRFYDVFASGVNWLILAADGTGGLPGPTLFSGTSTAVTHAIGLEDIHSVPTTDYSFGFAPASLAAGSYYLAVQAITSNSYDYLSNGVADSGAAQSADDGVSWALGYGDRPFRSVAMSLTGTFDNNVPEPGSLALLLVGLGAIYRRKTA